MGGLLGWGKQFSRWMVFGGVLFALGIPVASPTRADAEEDCPTWFPDFRCERDGRYAGFVPPTTMPYYFEEPFITTGIYIHGLWHDFPEGSVFEGGDARVLAAQIRVAVTDRLAFVATRDGWVDFRPDLDLLDTENGFTNWMFGFKYALIDWRDKQFILTPSIRYETSNGSPDVLSGYGSGAWIPAIAAGIGKDRFHAIGDVGVRAPVDGNAESTFVFYNLQLDYQVTDFFSPFLGINGIVYVEDGKGTSNIRTSLGHLPVDTVQGVLGTGRFEGGDITNLGSKDVDGNDLIVGSVGAMFPIHQHVTLGLAYERPLTTRKDIFKQRATASVIFEL